MIPTLIPGLDHVLDGGLPRGKLVQFRADRNGDALQSEPHCARGLAAFIDEFDDAFHLTGTPMRFTAHGPKVTDW